MKPPPFSYHDPRTPADAVGLLGTLENAKLLAGGQPDRVAGVGVAVPQAQAADPGGGGQAGGPAVGVEGVVAGGEQRGPGALALPAGADGDHGQPLAGAARRVASATSAQPRIAAHSPKAAISSSPTRCRRSCGRTRISSTQATGPPA